MTFLKRVFVSTCAVALPVYAQDISDIPQCAVSRTCFPLCLNSRKKLTDADAVPAIRRKQHFRASARPAASSQTYDAFATIHPFSTHFSQSWKRPAPHQICKASLTHSFAFLVSVLNCSVKRQSPSLKGFARTRESRFPCPLLLRLLPHRVASLPRLLRLPVQVLELRRFLAPMASHQPPHPQAQQVQPRTPVRRINLPQELQASKTCEFPGRYYF